MINSDYETCHTWEVNPPFSGTDLRSAPEGAPQLADGELRGYCSELWYNME